MNSVQRGYYRDTSAGATFETRVHAIRDVLVPGSRIVDVGCNDGRISLALLASGHASHSTGIDFENIVTASDRRFDFIAADLRATGASVVPQADAILSLNVVHHLLLEGVGFARRFVGDLLQRAETVLIDLGSLTERGPWPWRQLMGRLWANDEEVANDLFAAAQWRRPLCTYRAQNGQRVLWKLSAEAASSYRFALEQRFRRTIGTAPARKRLVPVADEQEVPPGCTDEVIFYRLRRADTQERFWAKRYLGPRAVDWRRDVERTLIDFLRTREPAASLPVGDSEDYGAIYPFDEELFAGKAVHYFDRHLLPRDVQRRFERLAHLVLSDGPFAGLPVGVVADPQAIATRSRVAFFDFEPSHHYTELLRFTHRATPAQRFQIISAFYDVQPAEAIDLPPLVRKEIAAALATDLFCEIARERLRVRRNRALRAGLRSLRGANVAGMMRNTLGAAMAELMRARRKGPAVRLVLRTLLARRAQA